MRQSSSYQDNLHTYQILIDLFDQVFFASYNTRLVKGDDEPIYLPAKAPEHAPCKHHQIVFAHGFFASALHEISHWCVAGEARRLLVDFGYWYCPDGRDAQQQSEFEKVEVKPQALEWCFSVAAGFPFKVSVDNLSGAASDRFVFQEQVFQQVQRYLEQGIPKRAQMFINALNQLYQTPTLSKSQFEWDGLNQDSKNKRGLDNCSGSTLEGNYV